MLKPTRNWITLGDTVLDLSSIVKIVFGHTDTSLFIISGEALLITGWTKDRAEIAKIKEFAALGQWTRVRSDADVDEDLLDDEQILVAASNGAGKASVGRDERVLLSAVDKLVVADTKASGLAAQLFAQGVFVGEIAGVDNIEMVKRQLGQP